MDLQIGGDHPVDVPQEADEVDAAVTALELADDLARRDVQGREQRRRTVAPIVVGMRLRRAPVSVATTVASAPAPGSGSSRPRTAPAPCPADPSRGRRHRATFATKCGSVDSLKLWRQMGLQAEGTPNPMHEVPRHAQLRRQAAHAPVRRVARPPVESGVQNPLHPLVAVPARLAGSRRIGQTGQTPAGKPAPPLGHGLLAGPMAFGDLCTGQSGRAIQHDPRPHVQPRTPAAPSAPTLKFRPLLLAQHDLRCPSSHRRNPRHDQGAIGQRTSPYFN